METFEVPNLRCAHCVRSVTEAVQQADTAAQVRVDLASHRVEVDSRAPRDTLVQVLTAAGYAPGPAMG
jgi:copper chaperone